MCDKNKDGIITFEEFCIGQQKDAFGNEDISEETKPETKTS